MNKQKQIQLGIVAPLRGSDGGVYQYSFTMLQMLAELNHDRKYGEPIVFTETQDEEKIKKLKAMNYSIQPIFQQNYKKKILKSVKNVFGESAARKTVEIKNSLVKFIQKSTSESVDQIQHQQKLRKWFKSFDIDLMIYPDSDPLSFETGIPYIMAIHDLEHRNHPEFPEVSADGEWERREYIFHNGSKNASFILVDSETGKEDVLKYYRKCGVKGYRIKILPFLPASYLYTRVPSEERSRVLKKYGLTDQYLFYPAQFWPHKNHIQIIKALGILRSKHQLTIPIVFCGSHSGKIRERTFQQAMAEAEKAGIYDQIRYLGFVPDTDLSGLYAGAEALVMPTFFGPTNIPPLEAWAFGCPVITSNIRGVREHSGGAALLVNPHSAEDIADHIKLIWSDAEKKAELIEKGKARISEYTPIDFRQRLDDILAEAVASLSVTSHPGR
jgi:glycosyltransferase involved in cell wall biosynthesis